MRILVTGGTERRSYFPFYDYAYELDVTAQNEILDRLLPLQEGLNRAYEWYKKNKDAVKPKNYFDYIEKIFADKTFRGA